MKLSKVDLSSLLAISHDGQNLGLVIDQGDSLEVIEISAPLAAYDGLMELNDLVASECGLQSDASFNLLSQEKRAIAMLPVESAMAKAVGYDPEQKLLQIEFQAGAIYQYEDVDQQTWEALQDSDSTGRFFNCKIKGNYRSRRFD